MEETLMMDDEELLHHIENLEGFDNLIQAVEEAQSRGYESIEQMKESI